MDTTFELLTLTLLPDVGPLLVRTLRERGALRNVLFRPHDYADLVPSTARERLASGAAQAAAEHQVQIAARQKTEIIGLDDPRYPTFLAQTYAPPSVLWTRGSLVSEEGARSVAIVGARACSPEGAGLSRCLGRDLAALGVTIVSGLARGIDGAAHQGALDVGGRTVAVLGSGLDRIYPPEHADLAARVADRGTLVSEFPLGAAPQKTHFPRRNRVIAGWSRAVVVVEASERSGALGTVRYALEEGRDVFAVPGHPSQRLWAGTNRLIREGATLVRDARDIACELGLETDAPQKDNNTRDDVLQVLDGGSPVSVDEIHQRTGRSLPELLARLSELELAARVERLPGALFVRL